MSAPATTGLEHTFPSGKILVSKTDVSGNFTYANEAYSAISGHDPAALIGQPHGIGRHPQVPGWVFEGMWQQLSKGKPWRGVLKNRCKNGDHYWVDAFITPIRKNGATVEYMSVQLEASQEQKARAEAEFARCQPPLRHAFSPRRFLSIKRGVLTGVIFVVIAMLVTLGISLQTLTQSAASFDRLHADEDILTLISQTDRLTAISQNQLFLALRHAPQNANIVAIDDIDLAEHLAGVRKTQEELDKVSKVIAERNEDSDADSAKTKVLIQAYLLVLQRYADKGLDQTADLLEAGHFAESEALLIGDLGSMVTAVQERSIQLSREIEAAARTHQIQMIDLLYAAPRIMAVWVLFVIITVIASALWFFRDTMGPLRGAIHAMQRIAEGDLNQRLELDGFGEPGELLRTLATMQIHLKVMLDEIRLASTNVHAQIGRLNQSVITVLNNTEDSHGQVSQIIQMLTETGSDTARLAARSAVALQLAQELSANDPDSPLLNATKEAATLANLNEFAASEIQRMSHSIVGYLGESRESVNDAWSAGRDLEKTSKALNDLLAKFD